MEDELLKRDAYNESFSDSPYWFGIIFGLALWILYAWVTRLRYGELL